jgi:hypothetical protein
MINFSISAKVAVIGSKSIIIPTNFRGENFSNVITLTPGSTYFKHIFAPTEKFAPKEKFAPTEKFASTEKFAPTEKFALTENSAPM